MPSADSGIFDENIVERCDFAMSRCQSGDHWNTLQTSLGKHPHAAGAVRVGRQHLRVRAEQPVFSCVSFLSLACPLSLGKGVRVQTRLRGLHGVGHVEDVCLKECYVSENVM